VCINYTIILVDATTGERISAFAGGTQVPIPQLGTPPLPKLIEMYAGGSGRAARASIDTPPCHGANDSVPNLPSVEPASGPVGSTVSIRIPISHVGQDGGPASFNGKAEVWWNIDWNTWYDAAGPKGPSPVVPGSVPTVLLTVPSDGTCELDGTFVVPADAAPGTYPIVVIGVTSGGGSALSGPELSFKVTS
jgi:hypothetical protein